VNRQFDAARRSAQRRCCKFIFGSTWCLSLLVIAFSSIATIFAFPTAGVVNDVCGLATIVTSDISQLGLLPELAEAGVSSCFGNGSLLSALGLGDELDFAGQVNGLATEVEKADLTQVFSEPLAQMRAFNESAAAAAAAGSLPGLGDISAMAAEIIALQALASCSVPTTGAFVALTLPTPCPYSAPVPGFTRENIFTPWDAFSAPEPVPAITAAEYMDTMFSDPGADPDPTHQPAWNQAILAGQYPLTVGSVTVQNSVQVILDRVAANISAVLINTRLFESALGEVQTELIGVTNTAVSAFTTQAELFVDNSQCGFVGDAFEKLHRDLCEDMLSASFGISVCLVLLALGLAPLGAFGLALTTRLNPMQLVKKLRAATAVVTERVRSASRAVGLGGGAGGRGGVGSFGVGRGSGTKARSESSIAMGRSAYGAMGGAEGAAGAYDDAETSSSVVSSSSTIGSDMFFDIRFTEQQLGLWLREEGAVGTAEHRCLVEGYAEDMIAPGTSELSTRCVLVCVCSFLP
tara:strand:+ start:2626 stop:4188 length:1563 start_codon:yes stop_codon:yes gene_type:complete